MGTQYLVPSANATDTGGILTTNNFEELDNGPTTDSVNGVVSAGGSEVGVGIATFQLTNPDESTIAKITSATLYARARIQNITDDTVTWRIRGVHTGGNADLTWTETDTTYTTQNAVLTSPTISSLSSMTVQIENTVYTTTKGSDNATFEIDEIWVEVVYEDEPNVRYWVGGTGTWNTTSTTNWAITSGGTAGYLPPKGNVDVFFDANSDSGTNFTVTFGITLAAACTCANLTVSGLDKVMTFAGTSTGNFLNLTKGLSFPSANFNLTYTGTYQFVPSSGTHHINTSNNMRTILISGAENATIKLASDLNANAALRHYGGIFDANNKNITTPYFSCWGVRPKTIYMGSGTWEITRTGLIVWDVQPANTTLYSNTSNIWLSGNTTSDRVFRSTDQSYYTLTIGSGTSTGNVIITGNNNSFYDIRENKEGPFNLLISGNTIVKTNNFSISGTSGNLITLSSTRTYPYKTKINEDNDGSPASDQFGRRVAISNNHYVIGALGEGTGGAIYVYHRANDALNYVLTSDIVNSQFGENFDVSDNYIIAAGQSGSGTVNAYHISNGTSIWSISPGGESYGDSIAISNNELYVAIGEPQFTQVDVFQGRVQVRSVSDGTLVQTISAPDAQVQGYFGLQVGVSDNYLVASTPGYDSASNSGVGRVYIFHTANGTLKQTIDSPRSLNGASWGGSLDMFDDYFIATSTSINSTLSNVYVYYASNGTLMHEVATPGASYDVFISPSYFGHSNAAGGIPKVHFYSLSSGNLLFKYDQPFFEVEAGEGFGQSSQEGKAIAISSDEKLAIVSGESADNPIYSNAAIFQSDTDAGSGGVVYFYNLEDFSHTIEKLGDDIVSVDYLDISYSNVTPNTLTWYAGANSVDSGNNAGWIFTAPVTSAGNFFLLF